MSYFMNKSDVTPEKCPGGHVTYTLLTEANGCINGCVGGISVYTDTEYKMPEYHNDQEGFVTLSGSGWARVGDEERPISAGTAFMVPKGVAHMVRAASDKEPVEVFWFHAAV